MRFVSLFDCYILQNMKHEKEKQGEKRENVVNVSCLDCLASFV